MKFAALISLCVVTSPTRNTWCREAKAMVIVTMNGHLNTIPLTHTHIIIQNHQRWHERGRCHNKPTHTHTRTNTRTHNNKQKTCKAQASLKPGSQYPANKNNFWRGGWQHLHLKIKETSWCETSWRPCAGSEQLTEHRTAAQAALNKERGS